jgi:hypothetical protein
MQFGLGVLEDRLREADVRRQRRWLGGLQQGRHRLERHQGADGNRRRFRRTRPSDSNSAHDPLRHKGARTLPPQATDWRIASMSCIWWSTQSPGLWEKMISRRASAQRRFCSGSIVSAWWIASACSWTSNGLTERT